MWKWFAFFWDNSPLPNLAYSSGLIGSWNQSCIIFCCLLIFCLHVSIWVWLPVSLPGTLDGRVQHCHTGLEAQFLRYVWTCTQQCAYEWLLPQGNVESSVKGIDFRLWAAKIMLWSSEGGDLRRLIHGNQPVLCRKRKTCRRPPLQPSLYPREEDDSGLMLKKAFPAPPFPCFHLQQKTSLCSERVIAVVEN